MRERPRFILSMPNGTGQPPVRERIIDNSEPRDASDNIVERRRRKHGDGAARGYHMHRGGCYDSSEDRSPSPEPPGPQVFSKAIHEMILPARFCPPRLLPSITARPNPNFGSLTSAWHVSWVGPPTTGSSSGNSPCSCRTSLEPGSRISYLDKSTTRTTS
jgi:hypothetical protein